MGGFGRLETCHVFLLSKTSSFLKSSSASSLLNILIVSAKATASVASIFLYAAQSAFLIAQFLSRSPRNFWSSARPSFVSSRVLPQRWHFGSRFFLCLIELLQMESQRCPKACLFFYKFAKLLSLPFQNKNIECGETIKPGSVHRSIPNTCAEFYDKGKLSLHISMN